MTSGQTQYSAAASLLGYLFQVRYALLNSLKRLSDEVEFTLAIEILDDVSFNEKGKPIELLQLKHHLNRKASLGNASTDIWKSMRIWIDAFSQNEFPDDVNFYLITTSTAREGSAAYYLRQSNNRDVNKSIQLFNEVIEQRDSAANRASYVAFRALSEEEKKNILKRVFIVDQAPSIVDIQKLMRKELYHAVETDFLDSFLEQLEGWWFGLVIKRLNDNRYILSQEIRAEEKRIREMYRDDNLPIYDDILYAEFNKKEYLSKIFVQQLSLIEMSEKTIFRAIQHYYRAFYHRSKWTRDNLLLVGELDRYEKDLIEVWEKHFDRMERKLGEDASNNSKIEAAQELYDVIEDLSEPIRHRCVNNSISAGSYQILADEKRVGWHLEFESLLNKLKK